MREGGDPVITATKTALRILGRRVLALDEEKARIDALLTPLVTRTAPGLLTLHGAGIDTAAALLVGRVLAGPLRCWDHLDRPIPLAVDLQVMRPGVAVDVDDPAAPRCRAGSGR